MSENSQISATLVTGFHGKITALAHTTNTGKPYLNLRNGHIPEFYDTLTLSAASAHHRIGTVLYNNTPEALGAEVRHALLAFLYHSTQSILRNVMYISIYYRAKSSNQRNIFYLYCNSNL